MKLSSQSNTGCRTIVEHARAPYHNLSCNALRTSAPSLLVRTANSARESKGSIPLTQGSQPCDGLEVSSRRSLAVFPSWNHVNRACLRAMVTGLFSKAHLCACCQVLEAPANNAITMKIDVAAVLGFDPARALTNIDLADSAMGGSRSGLHVSSPLALRVLQLAPCGSECVLQRDVSIFVRMVGRTSVSNRCQKRATSGDVRGTKL